MNIEDFCLPLMQAGVEAIVTRRRHDEPLSLRLTIAQAKRCGTEAFMNVHNNWVAPEQKKGLAVDQMALSQDNEKHSPSLGSFYIDTAVFRLAFAAPQLQRAQKIILQHHSLAQDYDEKRMAQMLSENLCVPVAPYPNPTGIRIFTVNNIQLLVNNCSPVDIIVSRMSALLQEKGVPLSVRRGIDKDGLVPLWLQFPLAQYPAVAESLRAAPEKSLDCRTLLIQGSRQPG